MDNCGGASWFILLSSEKNEPRSTAAVIHVLFLLLPPSYGHLPYILRCKTPRNTTGHGREEGDSNPPLKQSSPFFFRLPCDFAAR